MTLTRRETGRGFAAADSASVSVSNTTTETAIFTHTIQGGLMGTTKELSFRLICTLTSVLVPPNITVKIKFGGATLTSMSGISISAGLTATPFIIEGLIANAGTANAQIIYSKFIQANTSLINAQPMAYADGTIDTTINQVFQITVQFSGLSTTTILTYKHANVDLS